MKTKRTESKTSLDKCLITDMSSDVSVAVNDVFDQLYSENQEFKEQIRVYEEFKRFVDRLMTRMRSLLSDSEVETWDQLDSQLKTFANTSDSERKSLLVYESQIKSEETEDDSKPIPKTRSGLTPKVSDRSKREVTGLKSSLKRKTNANVGHKRQTNDPKKTKMYCKYKGCRQVFATQLRLSRHKFECHGLVASNRKLFVCDWPGCGDTQINLYAYKRHVNTHRDIRHHCSVANCAKSYKTLESLREHLESGHNERLIACTVEGCHKSFKSGEGLDRHIRLFHGPRERTAVCDVDGCPFKTYNRHTLAAHKRSMHSTDRPFQCTVQGCGKAFKDRTYLSIHESSAHNPTVTHFDCPVEGCHRKFKWKTGLKRHKMTAHSGQQFSCEWPGCEYQTADKMNLKKHGYVHKTVRDYPCHWPGCGMTFKCVNHVSKHMVVHKKDKRFGCQWPGCDYRCYNKGNVKKHEIQVHKLNKQLVAKID